MNDSGQVTARPGESKRISTNGLLGCNVVLLVSKQPDGRQTAILTHYETSESAVNYHISTGSLLSEIQRASHIKEPGTQHQVVILTLGEYEEDPDPDAVPKWKVVPKQASQTYIETIEKTLKKELGTDLEITTLGYTEEGVAGIDSRTFTATLPANPDESVLVVAPDNPALRLFEP